MLFGDDNELSFKPKIKVIGVGGAGGNAVDRMVNYDVKGVEFIAINTDYQDLRKSCAHTVVGIGKKTTRGLGAGAKPEVGRNAALEDEESIRAVVKDANMVFIACGMGGGTGTGAAPVIARVCKEFGILTVGIVTKPFHYEGPERMTKAIAGLEELKKYVDTLIVIPNERLFSIVDPSTSYRAAFREVDDILRQGVQAISEIIHFDGDVNVDFADVTTVMKGKGTALMGIGVGSGPNRAIEATRNALHSNLLEVSIDGATDAIVNIAASEDVTLYEIGDILAEIRNNCDHDLNIIQGTYLNSDLGDEIVVTIIATGYELKAKENGIENLASEIFSNQSGRVNHRRTGHIEINTPVHEEESTSDSIDILFGSRNTPTPVKPQPKKEESKSKISLPSWLRK